MELNEHLNQRRRLINHLRDNALGIVNTIAELAILQFCEVADLPRNVIPGSRAGDGLPSYVAVAVPPTPPIHPLPMEEDWLEQLADVNEQIDSIEQMLTELKQHEESSVPEMAAALVMTKGATTAQLRDLRKRQKFLQQMLDSKTT